MLALRAYDRARADVVKAAHSRLWRWEALALQAAASAQDLSHLLRSPFREVALAWVRKQLE